MLNSKKLEEVKCNLCGSNDTNVVGFIDILESQQGTFSTPRLTLVQCTQCSLAYINPQPLISALKEFYGLDYYGLTTENIEELLADKRLMYCGRGRVTHDLRFCHGLLREIERLSGAKGKLLDVGCGEGRLIKVAKDLGWEVFGQELSAESAKYAQDKFKVSVQVGNLIELNYAEGYFDAVTMLNVVEHLKDPFQYLKECNRVLRNGGILYLGTPNYYLNNADLSTPRDCSKFAVPEHLHYFSVETILKMLNKAGFEKIKLTTRNKQDARIGLDILKDYVKKLPNSISACKSYLLEGGYRLYQIMNAATGVAVSRRGKIRLNGGWRITVFARKL